jgi:methylmalonyl-CoA/ethylmalonyl-CoA epimerase
MRFDRIDHIAIATDDFAGAVRLYCDVLGASFVTGGDDETKGIRTMQVALPQLKIEILSPLHEGSYLHRYLKRHGPGFHHMTMFVEDVEEAIADVEAAGYETVDADLSHPAWREVYLRPRSAFGTLIQLVDTDRRWDVGKPGVTREDVLAGRIVWVDHEVHHREVAPEPVGRVGTTDDS